MDLGSYCDCPHMQQYVGRSYFFQRTSIKKMEFQQMTGQTYTPILCVSWLVNQCRFINSISTPGKKMFRCVD